VVKDSSSKTGWGGGQRRGKGGQGTRVWIGGDPEIKRIKVRQGNPSGRKKQGQGKMRKKKRA